VLSCIPKSLRLLIMLHSQFRVRRSCCRRALFFLFPFFFMHAIVGLSPRPCDVCVCVRKWERKDLLCVVCFQTGGFLEEGGLVGFFSSPR